MPTKTWVVGEEVLAADFNTYVQRQVVATFPNAAARDAALPSPAVGMVCALEDIRALQMYDGTIWIQPGKATAITLPQTSGIGGATIIPGSGWTLPSRLRRYTLAIHVGVFKGGVAGSVTIDPVISGTVALLANMGTPESRSLVGQWSVSGAAMTGGTFTITPSAGTVDVFGNSQIIVTDAGSI